MQLINISGLLSGRLQLAVYCGLRIQTTLRHIPGNHCSALEGLVVMMH